MGLLSLLPRVDTRTKTPTKLVVSIRDVSREVCLFFAEKALHHLFGIGTMLLVDTARLIGHIESRFGRGVRVEVCRKPSWRIRCGRC